MDGTITWSATEQTVTTTYNTVGGPYISVDSNGYVWVGYQDAYPYIIKSGNNNGTWGSTPAGFPYKLSVTANIGWIISIIPLTSGKMLALYAYTGIVLKAKRWDGAAWGAEKTTTAEVCDGPAYSATAQGDDVHVALLKKAVFDVVYTSFNYVANSFGVETKVQDGWGSTSIPVISIDAQNNLYVFWKDNPTPKHVYYRKYSTSWEARVDWITETDAFTGWSFTGFYKAYSGKLGYAYSMTAGPYTLKFDYLDTPPAGDVNSTIINMDADNWVFAEYKYYTFVANFTHGTDWNLLDSMGIIFSDGGGSISIQYRLSTARYTVLSGDDKIVLRIISAENITTTIYQIQFGVYFTKNVVDVYDVDITGWWNATNGDLLSKIVATDYFNIYNLGGRTEYRELGDASKSEHPVKSDPFDLKVTGGGGGDIEVNVTYRNLQQVTLLTHLIVPTNCIDDQYAGEWSAEYGIYYYADGSWTKGWNVKLEFSNGYVSVKDYWVYCHARWYRNDGVPVGGSEYFSSFFRPGLVNGTTVWVDLWFSNTNSSTAGGGRVSAEYYGMRNAAPWFAFWYSDWGPMLGNQTMSYYEMPLLNSTGGVISSRDVELVKVYSRLYKTSSTGTYTVEVKSPEVFDRKIARGDFTGIPTPPFVPPKVMDMPQGGMFGLLQTFLASIVAAITQALSPTFATCVAILDGIFAWAGWPGGFTQITTWISQMAGFMISAMGWMMTLLTGLFAFFTTTVPAMLYVVTSALTIYIDMIGKFWGYFTGAFGTGFDVWNDFGGTQWVTIGILIYPMYLLLLWTEQGLAPVMVHLDFWGGLIMGLINLAISLAGLVWSFISGLIENIPVVE